MDSAYDWKRYYAAERARLGDAHLRALLDGATPLAGPTPRALVIPHTRLEITGPQIAAAVTTLLTSRPERVLALGVLHGARRSDRDTVTRARHGDERARHELRGVHTEDGLASEEFSLDAFAQLLQLALGGNVDLVARYPFLVGDDPATLPGLAELQQLVADGAFVVATTDPMHHGHAYDTATEDCLDADRTSTVVAARNAIEEQLAALSDHRFADFQRFTEQHRSDFRDTGPVLASLLGLGFTHDIHDLALVDYAEPLGAPTPSWVAGALITLT